MLFFIVIMHFSGRRFYSWRLVASNGFAAARCRKNVNIRLHAFFLQCMDLGTMEIRHTSFLKVYLFTDLGDTVISWDRKKPLYEMLRKCRALVSRDHAAPAAPQGPPLA